MKVEKNSIPADSLVHKYLPANYSDVFACEMKGDTLPTPDDIIISFFTDMPGWVDALFRLRNFLVQFVGLKRSNEDIEKLKDCIRTGGKYGFTSVPDKNNNETVLLLQDTHLNAYLSVHIENTDNKRKNVSLITVVHFNNRLGNMYFAIIKPFHKIVVKSMLKRALSKQN